MTASADRRPLSGIRVFEISIAVAAPCCGKAMAHHGAEVFKVEAHSYPDVARAFGSAWARDPELADVFCDTGPYVPEMSAGKRSVGLELKQPEALEAARRLLATCDVFLTNFAAPGIAELGLDYESVKQVCPDIIYAGMTGFGVDPDKPYYPFRAFGPNQAPLVGWDALTGFPHEEPAGIPSIAPPDYMGGLHTMLAIVTALHERDRTGEGRFLDISQLETTVSFLGPYLVGQDLGVPEPFRNGNRVSWAAPAGIYRCAGDDRWIAVEVPDDEAWEALAGLAEWSDVPAHDAVDQAALSTYPHGTLADRIANHDAIDAELSAWTSRRSPQQAAAELQALGIAAYEVLNHTGVLADPQVHDRRPYSIAPSPRLGRDLFVRNPVRMSETPPYVTRAGPNMGGDTVDVLTEIGYAHDDVDQMVADGTAFVDARPEVVLERPFDRWYESVGIAEFYDAEGNNHRRQSMSPAQQGHGPWSGVRVLDLTGLSGAYGTRVWAALGADVICVEPPGGNPIRNMPPLAPGHEGPEASLWWAYYAASKRSVVLDPTDLSDVDALVQLIASADVVLDDAMPAAQEAYPWLADVGEGGLGVAGIVERYPHLTWVSITPFGMTGPRRHWRSSNLVAWASCGLASTVGFPHGPPLAPAGEIGVLMHGASLHAVIGSMMSVRARNLAAAAGEPALGQTIDLSLQEVGLWLSPETGVPLYLDDQVPRPRAGNRRPVTSPMGMYPASDGYVAIIAIQPAHWNAVAQWVHELTGNEGILDEIFIDIVVRREALEAVDAWVEELTTRFTKQELFVEGQRRRIPITPVNTVGDLRHDPHLEAVEWWRPEEHPVLGTYTVPGSPFSTDGDWWAWQRAPMLGEHTDEVLGELT